MSIEKGSRNEEASGEEEVAHELDHLLKDAPLTIGEVEGKLPELLDFYIHGVHARTHGDSSLWAVDGTVSIGDFEHICATALMRILTSRIDQNPVNKGKIEEKLLRAEIRKRLWTILRATLRDRSKARRR